VNPAFPLWLRLCRAGYFVVKINMKELSRIFSLSLIFAFVFESARAQTTWQGEWEKTLAAAKKEGKAVVGIPPSAELRKALESAFIAKFGI
jgi:hypothetical protein